MMQKMQAHMLECVNGGGWKRASLIWFLSWYFCHQPSLPICAEVWEFQAPYQWILAGYPAYFCRLKHEKGFLSPRQNYLRHAKVKCSFRKLLPEVNSNTCVFNTVWSNTQIFYLCLASKSSCIRSFIWFIYSCWTFVFSPCWMERCWLIIHEWLHLIPLPCSFYSHAKLMWNTTVMN